MWKTTFYMQMWKTTFRLGVWKTTFLEGMWKTTFREEMWKTTHSHFPPTNTHTLVHILVNVVCRHVTLPQRTTIEIRHPNLSQEAPMHTFPTTPDVTTQ